MTQSFDPFPVADLETNRAGRLSDEQRRRYQGAAGAFLKNEMFGAVACVVIAAILATSTGPAPNAWLRPFAAAGFIAIGILFLLRALTKGDSLAADVRAGRVETARVTRLAELPTRPRRKPASFASLFCPAATDW